MPADGLQQTFNVGSSATSIPRINIKFGYKKSDGSSGTVDLGNVAEGANVVNTLDQGAILGYDALHLAGLMTHREANDVSTATAPLARFSYRINGLTVDFDGSASANANATYSWNFGDLSSNGTGTYTSHTYAAAGTYSVTLTVGSGTTNAKTMTLTLSTVSVPPTAGLTVNSIVGKTVTITDMSSAGTVSVFVNWGDGIGVNLASAGSTTSHTYANNGTYFIIIGARNAAGGASTMKSGPIVVPNGGGATLGGMVSVYTGASTTAPAGDVYVTLQSAAGNAGGVYSSNTTTGTYTMAVASAGTYTVKASKYGYVFPDQLVTLGTGSNVTLDITSLVPSQLYTISGVVDSAPAGLLVACHVHNSAVVLGAQFTDLTGAFSFPNLVAGQYDIIAMPTGTHTVSPSTEVVTVPTTTIISSGTWTYQ
jgi:PKD repeat protein